MTRDLLEFLKDTADDPFDAVFEHAPIFLQSMEADGRLIRVSRAWAAALGYRPEQMVGRRYTEFLSVDSQRRARDKGFTNLVTGDTRDGIDLCFLRADTTSLPVIMTEKSSFDAGGNFQRSLAVMYDTSALRKEEPSLRSELQEARASSKAKSQFLAYLSHEIRTPMNAILGFAQLLKRADLGEPRQGYVTSILTAGGTLMTLLTDLLDLSQVEEGRMQIETRTFDLHDMLDQIDDWWRHGAEKRGLGFNLIRAPDLPARVVGDPIRMQQILNNYVGNAVKFTPSGTVTLDVTIVRSGADTVRLRFSVSDTGPGMTLEQSGRLFRPFVQIEKSHDNGRDGWGLGLAICQNIAKAMGGEVGVQSAPGVGSTFTLELNLDLAANAPPRPNNSGAGPAGLRILVAEDNAVNQSLLQTFLRGLGHSVRLASNGNDAIRFLAAEHFDLVILDLMMPELDGFDTAKRILAPALPYGSIPVIACSADVSDQAYQMCKDIGMDGFVPKPINRMQLALAIDQASGRNRLNRD